MALFLLTFEGISVCIPCYVTNPFFFHANALEINIWYFSYSLLLEFQASCVLVAFGLPNIHYIHFLCLYGNISVQHTWCLTPPLTLFDLQSNALQYWERFLKHHCFSGTESHYIQIGLAGALMISLGLLSAGELYN